MRGRPWFDLMRKVFHFLSQSLPPPLKVSAAASQWVVSSPHFSKSQLFVQASPNTKSQWVMPPPKSQINHKSNTKMTISSDIGSVLHQPCAVPGLLQSRFAIFRSIIFQILNEEQSFSFKISLDLYRSLWTAVRGCNSEFGLFRHTLRVLSDPPTPY